VPDFSIILAQRRCSRYFVELALLAINPPRCCCESKGPYSYVFHGCVIAVGPASKLPLVPVRRFLVDATEKRQAFVVVL